MHDKFNMYGLSCRMAPPGVLLIFLIPQRRIIKEYLSHPTSFMNYSTMNHCDNDRVIIHNEYLNVEELLAPMYATHESRANQTYAWRMQNLRLLRKVLAQHEVEWQEALLQDLGKHKVEAMLEINLSIAEIDYFLNNLQSLMQPTQASSMMYNIPSFSKIEHVPLRAPAVLIIGPCNYPLQLTLSVVPGALAAGNPVVIKPSELTPAVSKLMAKLCSKYFSPGDLQVVQGGREVVTPLLEHEWGKVVFTGSERVGKIVAEAAAKTLTPVLLELGGKSPCYVDENAPWSVTLAAQRIIWGKTLNCGQTVSTRLNASGHGATSMVRLCFETQTYVLFHSFVGPQTLSKQSVLVQTICLSMKAI